ncbi:MAG TPA: hypothetical protein PKA82_07325 [Pyrinomonadaceae bacterium]|nr:hypothetical protein [Pyrinomonadaceae bacterium]
MGLELVTLVQRLEDDFEIIISDEDATKMKTPRDVIEFISSHPKVAGQWSKEYVEITVWMAVEDELGIDKDRFNDDSRFVEDMGAG